MSEALGDVGAYFLFAADSTFFAVEVLRQSFAWSAIGLVVASAFLKWSCLTDVHWSFGFFMRFTPYAYPY